MKTLSPLAAKVMPLASVYLTGGRITVGVVLNGQVYVNKTGTYTLENEATHYCLDSGLAYTSAFLKTENPLASREKVAVNTQK